jgi:hypothetical protein
MHNNNNNEKVEVRYISTHPYHQLWIEVREELQALAALTMVKIYFSLWIRG